MRTRAHVALSSSAALLALAAISSGRAAVPGAVESAIAQISASELRAHVSTLASDEFTGRGLGQPGNRQAELYVADALRRAHVPPPVDTYFQPVQVYEPALGAESRLTVTSRDGATVADLTKGSNFYPLRESSDNQVSGPVVAAGDGVSAPEWGHDDYAGVEATGAIVLVNDGVPSSLNARPTLSREQKHQAGRLERKIRDARAHGAAGLLVVRESLPGLRGEWPEHKSGRTASYRLYARMREARLPVATLASEAAAPIRRALREGRGVTATLNPGVLAVPVSMNNVIGSVRGREAGGTIVVGAHLDHDGVDERGEIYNGADDNASGVAAVLAMAAAFARAAEAGERPARTMVFALWNGEEEGSLGAEYYLTNPVPAGRIVANVNLDMVGRNEEIPDGADYRFSGFQRTSRQQSANVVHLLGYSYSPDLARLVRQANASIKLDVKQDYDRGAQNLLERSDNWPFLQHGIPAVFLTTGLHPDYHTPADDTDRIDFAKLERIAELAARTAWLAADGPAPRMK